MIEEALIFALGFSLAGLIALATAPAFWRRAIRLSTRRLEMQLPLSFEEIQAERDLLRAEFAVESRRLEQKAQALNELHAQDMTELGRRAAIIARQEADLRALSDENSELSKEAAELHRALAQTSAELGATAKDSYDTGGLITRKDLEIRDLKANLEEVQALFAKQRHDLEALEAEMTGQKQVLAVETAKVAHLESQLSSLGLQHQADLVALKAAAARVADREEALEAAAKREKELIRQRKLQAEAARAAEEGYLEKIDRLRSAHAASQEALAAARRTCDRLAKELTELRATLPPQAEATALIQREENEILRRKISEIGEAVIRAAGGLAEAAKEEFFEKKILPEDGIPEKEAV